MQFSDKEENYRLILIFGPPLRTINRGKDLAEWKNGATFVPGKLAEWSIAAVLKTVEPQGSGGSNPSLSAKKKKRGCKSNLQPVLYLGRAEYIRDRLEYKTKCGRAAVSWACRDAPGRAGKDERHEAVGRSAAKSIPQSRNPGDHGATAT